MPMFSLGLHTYAVTLTRCLLKTCNSTVRLVRHHMLCRLTLLGTACVTP